jgi:hypothetical protein
MPAAWTAANLTFQVSHDGGSTYADLFDQFGVEIQASATVDRVILLDTNLFLNVRYMKIRSGTSATPVNQAAERSLILVYREFE